VQILQFRPYKKLNKEELISEIDRVRQHLNQLGRKDQIVMDYLDQLFLEARLRRISLSERDICHRILYSLDKEE